MKKVIISWSSGKDSAFTLHKMLASDEYQVVGLFTTYSAEKSIVPIQATPIAFVGASNRFAITGNSYARKDFK